MTEIDEDVWCAQQRGVAISYLEKEGISAPEVGDVPASYVSPYVSLWVVRSKKNSDAVGWWVSAAFISTLTRVHAFSASIEHSFA